MTDEARSPDHHDSQKPIALYRHSKRPEWGVAILAWEKPDKRGYQFEDGKLRVFKQGFYKFMHEEDVPLDEAAPILSKLHRHLGLGRGGESRSGSEAAAITFDEQRTIFSLQYPDGFSGASWKSTIRGEGSGRRLKRHRDGAIAEAGKVLAREELDAVIVSGDYDAMVDRVVELLRGTDLITATQLKIFPSLASGMRQGFIRELRDALYGDDEYPVRFDRLVRSLTTPGRGKPSWQLVTAFAALVFPAEHICVKPSSFRAQAETMAPTLRFDKSPSGRHYVRLQDMARRIEVRLLENGLQPKDLFDVYDFMWITLRPASRKLLEAASARPSEPEASEPEASEADPGAEVSEAAGEPRAEEPAESRNPADAPASRADGRDAAPAAAGPAAPNGDGAEEPSSAETAA